MLPSLDDIRELTFIIQRSNDMVSGSLRAREADAAELAQLRTKLEHLEQQAARSESVTRTLLSRSNSSGTAPSPAAAGSDLASMNVNDLVRLGQVVGDDEQSRVGSNVGLNKSRQQQQQQQQQPFGSLRALNDQRSKQQTEAAEMLENARARSMQARLHSLDRLRTRAAESIEKLRREQLPAAASATSSDKSSIWGPRATAAFSGRKNGGGYCVSSDVLDDALRVASGCWLEWADDKIQKLADATNKTARERDGDNDDDDDARQGAQSDPNRVKELYANLLVAAEFSGRNNSLSDCAADLRLVQQLTQCGEADGDGEEEEGQQQPSSSVGVADRARVYFENSSGSFPATRLGVSFV